jgi:branched-chain amino acid transport system ATP-binding protein
MSLQAGYGEVRVLWDVSLEVAAGELVCIIGSNGAGKTTLMRCLSGLLQPSAGSIAIDGRPMAQATPADFVRAGIAHVPEGRRLFSAMSIRDNLLMGAYLRTDKVGIAADLERIYGMFPILAERQRQEAGTLSGGEQQMLAIARALMGKPRLLLLDEPSMGLAPLIVQQIFDIVQEINESGVTVLIVEQNAAKALSLADRGYVLETGELVLSGSGKELLADDRVRAAYLGEEINA